MLGRFGKASGLDAGVILSTWNPDAGWEKDALVSYWRGSAMMLDVLSLQSLQQAAAAFLQQACQKPFCHKGTIHNEALRPWGVLCSLEAQQSVSRTRLQWPSMPSLAADLLQQFPCFHCMVVPP